ncbi:hypothetical protein ACFOGI_14445 [Virgibacillus xinjiangensis]|uniref:Uncharacterized protein n=1 Tax=Virgibacillus xinjiangensis TaxID=393090 RepID=A0ABV7CZP2_9BACI
MKNNTGYILLIIFLAGIAALLDIKFKGMFYRQLPAGVQERLDQWSEQAIRQAVKEQQ